MEGGGAQEKIPENAKVNGALRYGPTAARGLQIRTATPPCSSAQRDEEKKQNETKKKTTVGHRV